jgi:hypothetical protein
MGFGLGQAGASIDLGDFEKMGLGGGGGTLREVGHPWANPVSWKPSFPDYLQGPKGKIEKPQYWARPFFSNSGLGVRRRRG